jgi:hypothetical protein
MNCENYRINQGSGGGVIMALRVEQKFNLFLEAVEITKQSAGSGSQGCHVGDSLAGTLEKNLQ